MRFDKSGQLSSDIEDRRGRSSVGGKTAAIGGGGLGIGAIVLVVFQLLAGGGGDLGSVLSDVGSQVARPPARGETVETGGAATSEQDQFISFVIEDVQDFWTEQFASADRRYERSVLVLYEGGTDTAGCGFGQAAAGPFYCPADQKVYIDLSFFRQLRTRFGAPGDTAQAYVIAHEIGHHVQNVLGISNQVRTEQQSDPAGANDLSVRLELQADCLAGVWAFSAYDRFEPGDLEEALGAASAVGDDNIQESAGRAVNSETWTHGSSDQRVRWFRTGFDSGDPNQCDTFSADL